MDIAALTAAVEAIETGLDTSAGNPSPSAAWTEDPDEYRDLGRRCRAAIMRGAGQDSITSADVAW